MERKSEHNQLQCTKCGVIIDKKYRTMCVCKECGRKMYSINKYKKQYSVMLNEKDYFNTYSVVQWYKWTVEEPTPSGKYLTQIPSALLTLDNIKTITQYVVLDKLKWRTKEEFCNLTQPIMNKYKIGFSKTEGIKNSPYKLITLAFPELDIQEFQMVHATCNYWRDYKNFLKATKYYFDKILDNEAKNNLEYYFSHKVMLDSFNCLAKHYAKYYNDITWDNILKDIGIDYKFKYNLNCLNEKMSSQEEVSVFNFIYLNLNIKDVKNIGTRRSKKFYNEKYDENYCPDFIITKLGDKKFKKPIIIEYYGLFTPRNKNELIQKYVEKAYRKNEYYKSRDDIYFIDLYPDDLKNNMQGVREKLTSFLMLNFSIDIKYI
jgi:hypothetical protein